MAKCNDCTPRKIHKPSTAEIENWKKLLIKCKICQNSPCHCTISSLKQEVMTLRNQMEKYREALERITLCSEYEDPIGYARKALKE